MPATLALVRQRYTAFGGAERFVAAALESLAREGVALRLYTRSWPKGEVPYEVVKLDPPYLGSLWRDISFERALRRSLDAQRPTLVQTHERIRGCDIYRAGDGVHAVWLEERQRAMTAWQRLRVQSNPFHRHVLAAERALFADPTLRAVICNSRLVMQEIERRFAYPRERLHLVYNAVDSQRYSPALREMGVPLRQALSLPSTATVCLLLGSGYARKGLAAALGALQGLPRDVYLLVVGRERRLEPWRSLAQNLGVEERVRLLGAMPDPRAALGAADVFLLPTIYDPCPNAALEAMACGVPVVTSTQCGVAELLHEHGGGMACDARDLLALRAAIEALRDRVWREQQGAAARAAVLPLSAEAMSAKLLALYHSLLQRPGAETPLASGL
ncbi:MAG: glycosyltransferase family 4 protein [Betaproteobacteria bacterium]|nr:glycosyltransferase family 4 protein [Betaproteobacteria bacterium]